jgi:hypothetical protein
MVNMTNGVERTLGKILATQEHIMATLDGFTDRLEAHIKEDKEIERRLDKIEHKLSYAYGVLFAVAGIFSLVSSFFLKKLGLA